MAKTTRWTGTTDGDLTDTTNWTNGAVAATDTGIWDGSSSVNVDINAAALTASNLAKVIIESDYSGNLGNSGTPLEFSADHFTFKGTGTLYFNNGSTSATDELFVDAPSGTVFLGDHANANAITLISLLACRNATLTSTLSATNLFINSGVNAILQGSGTFANVYLASGATVTSTATITNLFNGGGTWTQLKGGAAIANMYLASASAVVNYFATAQITLAIMFPGSRLELRKGPQPKDLVTGWVFPGASIGRIDDSVPTNGGTLRPVVNLG